MSRNIVIRKCDRCGNREEQGGFDYMGDGVFRCPRCPSKRTSVEEVIDPDKEEVGNHE